MSESGKAKRKKAVIFSGVSSQLAFNIADKFNNQQTLQSYNDNPAFVPSNSNNRKRSLPQFTQNGWAIARNTEIKLRNDQIEVNFKSGQVKHEQRLLFSQEQYENDDSELAGINPDDLFNLDDLTMTNAEIASSSREKEKDVDESSISLKVLLPSTLNQFFFDLRNDSIWDDAKLMNLHSPKSLPLFNQRIIVMDTETTGFLASDEIIELSCVEVLNGVITGSQYHAYIYHPNAPRSHPLAERIHGITQKHLEKYGNCKDIVFPAFMDFVSNSPVVFYNKNFDLRALKRTFPLFEKLFRELTTFCLMEAHSAYRKFGSHVSLEHALRLVRVPCRTSEKHSALEDSLLAAYLFQAIWKDILEKSD